jgi:phosphoribosyl 1,2-cyclic phosphodiesterase
VFEIYFVPLHEISKTSMLRFLSFGSGSSGNCYLLATPNDALLIDVGVGLRGLKKACRDYGISLSQIHHVLVTHDHADHIKSVGSFSHDYHVPVYAIREVHQGINRNYCVTQKLAPEMTRILDAGTTVQIGDFLVTPFTVPHDSSGNVGYFIEAEGTNFCIITDAGMVTDEMKSYIQRARHLVIEATHDTEMVMSGPYPKFLKDRILSSTGHLSNRDCAQTVVDNMSDFLQHIWLCHLSEENNHPELARKTVETVLRSYGVIAGTDVQLEVLKRTTPTGPFDLT